MQFNGETNNQDICSTADDLAKSNSQSFKIASKVRYANMGSKIIWSDIFEVWGGWLYDDSNYTTLPEATTQLNASETQITFPDVAQHLIGISIKDQSGNWYKLKPITLEAIQEMGYSESQFMTTPGQPEYYRPVANGAKLYPAANYTQSASVGLHLTREAYAFTILSTDSSPGFASTFHDAVAVFMALMYAKKNDTEEKDGLQDDWDGNFEKTKVIGGWRGRIRSFYGSRFRQLFPGRIRIGDPVSEYE